MKAAREYVAKGLEDAFPGWRIVASPINVDALDRLTVFVNVTNIGRAPEAPMGAYATTVTLTLVSPKSNNWPAAEAELEGAMESLVFVLEEQFGTAWGAASKVTVNDTSLAWNIPLTVITSRKDD